MSLGDDPAVVHDHQPVAERIRFFEVVGREEDGGAPFPQVADVVPQVGPVLRVEPGARFVEEQHLGPVDDAQGHVQPPALAARIGLGPSVGELGEVEDGQHLVSSRRTRALPPP